MSVRTRLQYALKAVSNVHAQGPEKNILLFATARGGSTWVMEILASQPGMKYYDEPFNIRRDNVARTGLFPAWDALMPDTGDTERIVGYLEALRTGGYRHMNPPPFRRNHRFLTNRIVFKIHELKHLIGAIARRCDATVVYLLRHPIPTTLSRTALPQLDLFLQSPYYANLIGDPAVVKEIRSVGAGGTAFQQGIVSWCYENVVPLRFPDFDGLFVTYEELVLNPVRSCDLLMRHLRLTDRDAMLRAFAQPANNLAMSSARTQSIMEDADQRRRQARLVTKWKESISPRDEADAAAILEMFEIDAYRADRILPARPLLHFADTEQVLYEIAAGGQHDLRVT